MIQITEKLMPFCNSRPGTRLGEVIGVTIHNTGNYSKGAGAKNHMLYQTEGGGKNTYVSYHYVVDDKECYRLIPEDEVTYHSGTIKGNTRTLSIEICVNPESDILVATNRAVELAAFLLKKHGLNESNLYQHYDWNKKECPAEIRKGNPYDWNTFKVNVSKILNSQTIPEANTPIEKTIDQLAKEVLAGKHGNGDARKNSLGSLYNAVQDRVNEILYGPKPVESKKTNEQIAREVIRGDWGNGQERKDRLKAAGYDSTAIQSIVNRLLG